jgi:hypothetical protein
MKLGLAPATTAIRTGRERMCIQAHLTGCNVEVLDLVYKRLSANLTLKHRYKSAEFDDCKSRE